MLGLPCVPDGIQDLRVVRLGGFHQLEELACLIPFSTLLVQQAEFLQDRHGMRIYLKSSSDVFGCFIQISRQA